MKIVKKYQNPDGPIQQQEPVQQKKRHGLWWHMMHPIRKRLYNNITPAQYDNPGHGRMESSPIRAVWNAVINNKSDVLRKNLKPGDPTVNNALWAKYLNLDDSDVGYKISDYVEESPYRFKGRKAYRLKNDVAFTNQDPEDGWRNSDAVVNVNKTPYGIHDSSESDNDYDGNLGHYFYGRNNDYVWYHDRYDLNPFHGSAKVQKPEYRLYDNKTGKRMYGPESFYIAQAFGMSEKKFRKLRNKYGSSWVNQQAKDKGVDLLEVTDNYDYTPVVHKKRNWRNLFKGFGDLSFGIGRPFHLYDRYYTDE